MGASVILHNMIHPTVNNDTQFRSVDLQVNGFGFYRTVKNGTIGLLQSRLLLPVSPTHSVVHHVDTALLPGDTLYFQPFLLAKRFLFDWTFRIGDYAFTTNADRGAILSGSDSNQRSITGQLGVNLGFMPTSTLSQADGAYTTHYWELDTTVQKDDTFAAWGTYNWEGMGLYFVTTSGVIQTLTNVPRQEGVGFKFFDMINTSLLSPQVPARFPNDDPALAGSWHVQDVYVTQHWEISETDIRENLTSLAELPPTFVRSDITGLINSEDASGRRATHRWEIDLFDIVQTSFWSWQDIKADSALGAPVEEDNDPPVGNNQLSIFQEHAFLSGDPDNPHFLYWSKRFRPESWPPVNFLEIGTANHPIQTHVPIAGVLGVFAPDTKYRVTGNDTAGFIKDEAISHRGAPSIRSVVPTDQGVFFVARDGVFITNFISPDVKISDAIDSLFLGETKNGYEPINFGAVAQIAGGFYKNKYYFSYPAGTSTVNNTTAIYSVDGENWTFWDLGFGSFFAERDTNLFLAGGASDSLVRVIENPTVTDDIVTPFADDFNRSNGGLGNQWLTAPNIIIATEPVRNLQISSNEITATAIGSNVRCIQEWTQSLSVNQYAQITASLLTGTGTYLLGVILRSATNGPPSWYEFTLGRSIMSPTTSIIRVVGGTATTLASTTATTWVTGDILRAEAKGSELRLLRNGSVLLSATDTALLGPGRPGAIALFASGTIGDVKGDTWSAGSLDSPDGHLYIPFELQTRDFTGSTQTTRNLFLYFKVDAECSVDSMIVEFFVDDVLKKSHTIAGSRTSKLLSLPENTIGNKWRVRTTYTGAKRVAVYGVTAIFVPLMAA